MFLVCNTGTGRISRKLEGVDMGVEVRSLTLNFLHVCTSTFT